MGRINFLEKKNTYRTFQWDECALESIEMLV